jgi:plasmid stabilization system protein ParE
MRVVLTQAARADLREIGHWIARDNVDQAIAFVRQLRAKCFELSVQPLLFPVADEIGPDIRKRTHGRYLILYRIRSDRVEILRILNSARDYPRLFKKHGAAQ